MNSPIRNCARAIALIPFILSICPGQEPARNAVVTTPEWVLDADGEFVTISYGLSEAVSKTFDVELTLANTEQGTSFEPSAVTGHIGTVRAGASRKIIWHYRKDFPNGLAGRGWKFILNLEWRGGDATVASREGTFTPPRLRLSPATLSDPNANGRLDAGEEGELSLTVTNDGIGAAMGTTLTFRVLPGMTGFRADTTMTVGDLAPGGKSLLRLQCSAGPAVNTGEAEITVRAQDRFQYTFVTDTLRVPVQAYLPPALELINGWIRSGLNPSARRLAEAAQVVRGDTTELILQIRNRGRGKADGLTASVMFEGEGWNVRTLQGGGQQSIRDLPPDSSAFVSVSFVADERAEPEFLLARLAVAERRPEFGINEQIRLPARRRFLTFDAMFIDLMRRAYFDSAAALCKRQMAIEPGRASLYSMLGSAYDSLGERSRAVEMFATAAARGDRPAAAWLHQNAIYTEATSVRYESTPLPFLDAGGKVTLGVFTLPPTADDPKGERLYATLRTSVDLKRIVLIPYRALISQLGVSAVNSSDTAALARAARQLGMVYVIEGRDADPAAAAFTLVVRRAANGQTLFTRRFQPTVASTALDDVARLFRESMVPVYSVKRAYRPKPARSR